MNKKLFLIIGGVIVVAAILYAVFFPGKGTLTIEVNSLSPVQDEIAVYLATKRHPEAITPPATIEVRAGRYELVAIAPGAEEYRETIRIRSGQTTAVSLTLTAELGVADQQEITLTQEEMESPLVKLFPHNDTNFSVTAEFSRDESGGLILASITITPYLPISAGGGYNEAEVAQAKEEYVAEAKAWLTSNNVPETVPITIDSPF